MIQSTKEDNLEKLSEIQKSNPTATHVYFKRDDDAVVDIPVKQAEFTVKQNPNWEIVSSNKNMDDEVEQLFDDLPVPPKPSEKGETGFKGALATKKKK